MGHGRQLSALWVTAMNDEAELTDATRMMSITQGDGTVSLMRSDGVCISALRPQIKMRGLILLLALRSPGWPGAPQIQVSLGRIVPVLGNIPIERLRSPGVFIVSCSTALVISAIAF